MQNCLKNYKENKHFPLFCILFDLYLKLKAMNTNLIIHYGHTYNEWQRFIIKQHKQIKTINKFLPFIFIVPIVLAIAFAVLTIS